LRHQIIGQGRQLADVAARADKQIRQFLLLS
jgi:hypothetical protein